MWTFHIQNSNALFTLPGSLMENHTKCTRYDFMTVILIKVHFWIQNGLVQTLIFDCVLI